MRTARWLTNGDDGGVLGVPPLGGASLPGGVSLLGGLLARGVVTYPIMHLMFPVCCLHTECQHMCSSLYSVTQVHAGIPPPPLTEWQTGAKILPYPKLRLWPVKIRSIKYNSSRMRTVRCRCTAQGVVWPGGCLVFGWGSVGPYFQPILVFQRFCIISNGSQNKK